MQQLLRKSLGLVAVGTIVSLAVAGSPTTPPAPPLTTLRALYGMTPPRRLSAPHTALVLVDFQEEFFHGRLPLSDGKSAVAHAAALAAWARRSGIAVIHVRNQAARADSPLFAPGSATTRFVSELEPRPGELVITKSMAGAFSHTNLNDELKQRSVDTLIVGGLMTHLAVQSTAADATVLGYHSIIAADAVTTRALPGAGGYADVDAATLQRASLAILADRMADVMTNRALLALPIAGS
jgi:nicotinamidase-related amidase